jgi:osmoprotectant transport system ATP-binding protein
MQTQYAIEFNHVSKVFPKATRASVQDCTFQIEKGEFIVILGASGSGKTTLLKMVNRLYAPTSGEIRVDGVSIDAIHPVLLRRNIGYVIQQIALYPHMSVEKNIATVPTILGWNRERIRDRVNYLLNLVHLPPEEYAKRYPRELSGGQQQRVGIARALAGDPAVLLMDEPFGAVDAITRASLQQEIKRIQRDLDKTLLFVTHDVDEALKLADRIIVMENGQVIQFDTPLKILAHPATSFVNELTHADDILQRLSLIPVQSVIEPSIREIAAGELATGEIGTIQANATLKDALAVMVRSGSNEVYVTGHDDSLVGKVTLEGLSKVGS